jgi:probable addiction module antidote protein
MSIKTSRWNSAEYLKTDEDIQLYLEACIEEAGDDPAFIVHALGVIARAKNMSQLARDTGLTREGLYKAFSPEGNPTFTTVAKVAKALGLQITVQTSPIVASNNQLQATSQAGV